jgi:glycosyltransferase involved in cell wall biosynthesis
MGQMGPALSGDRMKPPAVSVVINFFDARNYLQEAIDSVFAQSWQNWELLLVDDGSTDGSSEIARACAARHPGRVRYLEHPGHANRGGAAARNLGIFAARGERIAFLDADDVWLPNKLEKQIEVVEMVPAAAMVYGLALVWHSWNGSADPSADPIKGYAFARDDLVDPPAILESFLRSPGNTPFPSAVLIRRQVAWDVEGFAEEVRGTHDDQAFFAKICLRYPIFVMSDPTFRYRVHEDSLCQQELRRGENEAARLRFLEWLERYLEGRVDRRSPLWAHLRREFLPYRRPGLYRAILLKKSAKRNLARIGSATARRLLPGRTFDSIRRHLRPDRVG